MYNPNSNSSNEYPSVSEKIGRHLGTGATPLSKFGRPDVNQTQLQVFDALILRHIESTPPDVPRKISDFVIESFMNRFHERATKNENSYYERLKQDLDGIEQKLLDMHERAITGTATPEELLIVRREFGLRSIELARLTHPYGTNIDQLDGMLAAVEDGIRANGGKVYASDSERDVKYKIRSLIRDHDTPDEYQDGFLMTRRRMIGVEEDDTFIQERTSFVVRTDPAAGLEPELVRELHKVRLTKEETWVEDISAAFKLDQTIPALLEENNTQSIIRMSTTIYAFNKSTAEQIERRKNMLRQPMQLEEYPEISRLRQLGRQTIGMHKKKA